MQKQSLKDEKARTFAFYNFFTMNAFGIGLICSGFIVHLLGFAQLFTMLTGLYGLLFLVAWFLPKTKTASLSLTYYTRDFLRLRVLLFAGVIFLFFLHIGAESTSLSLFVEQNLGLSKTMVGIFLSSELFVFALTPLLFGKQLDKGYSIIRIFILGLFFSGVGQMVMTIPIVWVSLLARMTHGFGDSLVFMVGFVGVGRLFHIKNVGGSDGFILMVTQLSSFIAAIAFGPLGEMYGYGFPLFMSGLIMLIIIVVILSTQSWWQKVRKV